MQETLAYLEQANLFLVPLDNERRWYRYHHLFRELLRLLSGEFCADTSRDRYHAHDLLRHFTIAFLLAELKQDRVAAGAMAPGTVEFSDVTFEATGY